MHTLRFRIKGLAATEMVLAAAPLGIREIHKQKDHNKDGMVWGLGHAGITNLPELGNRQYASSATTPDWKPPSVILYL